MGSSHFDPALGQAFRDVSALVATRKGYFPRGARRRADPATTSPLDDGISPVATRLGPNAKAEKAAGPDKLLHLGAAPRAERSELALDASIHTENSSPHLRPTGPTAALAAPPAREEAETPMRSPTGLASQK